MFKNIIDINDNQKSVSKSLVYDLTAILEQEQEDYKLKDREIITIKACHRICKAFYDNPKSPFFMQIRMLGTGTGCISQSFMIEFLYPIIHDSILKSYSEQDQFNALYYYFKAVQAIFPDDWPVLANVENIESQIAHSDNVLKIRKSQLPKTLGVGALLLVFPKIFEKCNFDFESYKSIISALKDKIIWSKDEYNRLPQDIKQAGKYIYIETTNQSNVKKLSNEILKLI